MNDLTEFLSGRIEDLTKYRKKCQDEGDFSSDDYLAGAIDAYDLIRIKING